MSLRHNPVEQFWCRTTGYRMSNVLAARLNEASVPSTAAPNTTTSGFSSAKSENVGISILGTTIRPKV